VGSAHPTGCLIFFTVESLTEEEQEFMRTMEQVDAWFEAEIAEVEQKAQERGEVRGEERKQQEIASNLLRKNIPLEVIAEATGLTIEKLQFLQSQPANN
jgi:predicted transposase/invertase (TIGR01784 family)